MVRCFQAKKCQVQMCLLHSSLSLSLSPLLAMVGGWERPSPKWKESLPQSLSHHPHPLTGLLYLVWEHSCPCVCMARFSTRHICVQVASRGALTRSLYLRLQPPTPPGDSCSSVCTSSFLHLLLHDLPLL